MAENDKQEQQKVTGNERSITVEIGHFPQDIDEATYRQIIDAAYQFSIQLPGHVKCRSGIRRLPPILAATLTS